jgi:hypothetical protein
MSHINAIPSIPPIMNAIQLPVNCFILRLLIILMLRATLLSKEKRALPSATANQPAVIPYQYNDNFSIDLWGRVLCRIRNPPYIKLIALRGARKMKNEIASLRSR